VVWGTIALGTLNSMRLSFADSSTLNPVISFFSYIFVWCMVELPSLDDACILQAGKSLLFPPFAGMSFSVLQRRAEACSR
jgi:hypothetical protein